MSVEDPGTPVPRKMSIQQQQPQEQPLGPATIDSPISTTTVEDVDDDDEGGGGGDVDNDDPLTQSSLSTLNPASHSTSSLPENCTLASSKDNAYFHALFKSVPEHDRLLEIYKCALHRDILLQGHLYLSENYVCFHANIFGWITNAKYNEIVLIERKMTAMIIPNGIQINTQHAKHTFASFIFREAAYQQLISLWAIHKPHQLHSTAESSASSSSSSEDDDDDYDSSDTTADSIHNHHHHHHHDKDTTKSFTSRYWKGLVVLLLLLHSGWMIRQWMRLGHHLQPPEDNFLAQPHHIYSRLDHLRQRMEVLNQQILEQQLLLYDLSPPRPLAD